MCHRTNPPSTERQAEPDPLRAKAEISPSSSNNLSFGLVMDMVSSIALYSMVHYFLVSLGLIPVSRQSLRIEDIVSVQLRQLKRNTSVTPVTQDKGHSISTFVQDNFYSNHTWPARQQGRQTLRQNLQVLQRSGSCSRSRCGPATFCMRAILKRNMAEHFKIGSYIGRYLPAGGHLPPALSCLAPLPVGRLPHRSQAARQPS